MSSEPSKQTGLTTGNNRGPGLFPPPVNPNAGKNTSTIITVQHTQAGKQATEGNMASDTRSVLTTRTSKTVNTERRPQLLDKTAGMKLVESSSDKTMQVLDKGGKISETFSSKRYVSGPNIVSSQSVVSSSRSKTEMTRSSVIKEMSGNMAPVNKSNQVASNESTLSNTQNGTPNSGKSIVASSADDARDNRNVLTGPITPQQTSTSKVKVVPIKIEKTRPDTKETKVLGTVEIKTTGNKETNRPATTEGPWKQNNVPTTSAGVSRTTTTYSNLSISKPDFVTTSNRNQWPGKEVLQKGSIKGNNVSGDKNQTPGNVVADKTKGVGNGGTKEDIEKNKKKMGKATDETETTEKLLSSDAVANNTDNKKEREPAVLKIYTYETTRRVQRPLVRNGFRNIDSNHVAEDCIKDTSMPNMVNQTWLAPNKDTLLQNDNLLPTSRKDILATAILKDTWVPPSDDEVFFSNSVLAPYIPTDDTTDYDSESIYNMESYAESDIPLTGSLYQSAVSWKIL